MEVLALIGSPRKQGNTDIMADEVLAGARIAGATTLKIYLDDYLVRPIAEVGNVALSLSSDLYHGENWQIQEVVNAVKAAKSLDLESSILAIKYPKTPKTRSVIISSVVVRYT